MSFRVPAMDSDALARAMLCLMNLLARNSGAWVMQAAYVSRLTAFCTGFMLITLLSVDSLKV